MGELELEIVVACESGYFRVVRGRDPGSSNNYNRHILFSVRIVYNVYYVGKVNGAIRRVKLILSVLSSLLFLSDRCRVFFDLVGDSPAILLDIARDMITERW